MKRDWGIQVEDPSGEIRRFPLKSRLKGNPVGRLRVGIDPEADIPLRDPKLSGPLFEIEERGTQLWLKLSAEFPGFAYLADLAVREAILPPEIPVQIGETRLRLTALSQDEATLTFPKGVRPWLTDSTTGRELLWNARKAAGTPLAIYLSGETGTGKDVLANLIHAWSLRASGPFIPLNCAALPVSLADSELFGHVKGAFTGAIHSRPGALLQAHGGTLFLDEVGDLPLDIQVKLLRFLENGEIRSVGSDRTSRADVRIVCATHKPLLELVEKGQFRRDLYYRIASVSLQIPPLRSRPEDIRLLVRQFAEELERELSPLALMRIQAHCWLGNVRELRHAVERACGVAGPFQKILSEDCFHFLTQETGLHREAPEVTSAALLTLHEMERFMLLKALRITEGNRAQAAQVLGVARSTLFEMLRRHRILGPRRSRNPKGSTDD